MRRPRLRFTVRRLMVAVAIVGVPIGVLAERNARFSRVAARFRVEQEEWVARCISTWPGSPAPAHAEWCAAMARKYDRAAHHPWLPVAPDPPEPE